MTTSGRLATMGTSPHAIMHHYDVSDDFFRLWLGPDMVYSCGWWETGDGRDSLARAQHRKIDQRLCDPALGPPETAAAVNISVRYLHKLFKAEHRSVSQYVKGLRLERSRRELLDPRLTGRSIAAVAFDCGFGDLSGFNRAFKDAYGITPRELRTAPRRETAAERGERRTSPVTELASRHRPHNPVDHESGHARQPKRPRRMILQGHSRTPAR
jgi:AraC-like DNA-binding protein